MLGEAPSLLKHPHVLPERNLVKKLPGKTASMKPIIYLIASFLLLSCNVLSAHANQNNRVIILTDMGADPDDSESMVRLLLYSNQIEIKGLIATTSIWQKNIVRPEMIDDIVHAYGKVQSNLLKHEAGFPTAESLEKTITHGIAAYGMQGVGEGKDSPGSELIINVLKEKDDRPLWIPVWGGVNTLAQALYKIKKTETEPEAKRLIAKLRVYTISDQDDSGIWIRNNFPELFYIVSPGDDYGGSTWGAINSTIDGINNETISNKWLAENIQQSHGALGAVYPDVSYGMEGDTPSYLNLIPNGLSDAEHPNWGGWGGRYEFYQPDHLPKKGPSGVPLELETRSIWTNAIDNYIPAAQGEYGRATKMGVTTFTGNKVTLWRWRDDFQNDLAARMSWCNQSYQQANHPPVPKLLMADHIIVKSGERFSLNATATDPDGDSLSYLWFNYAEAGSYKQLIKIDSAENLPLVNVVAPVVDQEQTAHFILRVTDKGKPQLSRYKRVIVTVLP